MPDRETWLNFSFCKPLFVLPALTCLFLFRSPTAVAVDYEEVAAGVSYDSVMALDFTPAGAKIPYGSDPLQYGLLWLPEQQAPLAHIVFIHGGCWLNAYDISHTFPLSTALAQAGYAVWSLEYRRTGDVGGGWPGSFEDIQAGIAHLAELALPGLNQVPVILIGHSAGGHLALLAGAGEVDVQAVIGLAAISDILSYARGSNSCETATAQFMGGEPAARAEAYQAANPAQKLPHRDTVLLHGSADQIVPLQQAFVFGADTLIVQDAGHFDWVHPGTEAFGTLLEVLQNLRGTVPVRP
ncbi:MAG: alpha/beta hydrolase [Pseudomonadales bacterium]|nr:alpha/beta hydrolase [Pseudomonadales bacterium]